MNLPQNVQPGQTGHDAWHREIHAALKNWYIDSAFSSLQAAVNAAAGGDLHVTQTWTLDEPLILPRASNGSGAVQLIGHRGAVLKGSAGFPEGRALVEWEVAAERAFDQRIANLRFDLPNVAGVKAIHYQPTAKSNFSEQNAERLQIYLENLYITAHNDYHESLIKLEGAVNRSVFRNVSGDPALGSGTYATLLLDVDSDLPQASDIANDMVGLLFCHVERLYPMIQRGGRGSVFRGRMNGGYFGSAWCNGGGADPCFDFINCIKTIIEDTGTEGYAEKPQYKFTNCHWLDGRSINIGTPNGDAVGIDGAGNGLELHDCADCRFDGRYVFSGNPHFSGQGQGGAKVVIIDAGSKRNVFSRWGVKTGAGGIAAELQIDAPESAGNRIEYVDVTNDVAGTFTGV